MVIMGTDPEELLRSIERTREELAHTVDTIAGRLDPKFVAKRGVGKLRDGVTGMVDGVKARFDHHADRLPQFEEGPDDEGTRGYRADKAMARASSAMKSVPKPVIGGGLAALVALAAVLYAANRRQRR
jgi:hypothetical protein